MNTACNHCRETYRSFYCPSNNTDPHCTAPDSVATLTLQYKAAVEATRIALCALNALSGREGFTERMEDHSEASQEMHAAERALLHALTGGRVWALLKDNETLVPIN